MSDLSTTYMGMKLKSPLVVASSSLTKNISSLERLEAAGAGAVTIKSLFEEQILGDMDHLEQQSIPGWHTEAQEYIREVSKQMGVTQYFEVIRQAKQRLSIPVVASINCVSPGQWVDYARRMEEAGADALELNIALMPVRVDQPGKALEKVYVDIVKAVKAKVSLPVAVKIGPYITNLFHLANELVLEGVSGLVIFNRFYEIDVDIDDMRIVPGRPYSSPVEMHLPLRWIALLANRVECDLAASTGVHSGAGVVKQLLAGATVVQVCSVLFEKGPDYLKVLHRELEAWMQAHRFDSVDAFRGRLSQEQSDRPEQYTRLQYIRALVGIE